MTVLIDRQQNAWRGATLALSIGLALSLASIAGLLVDQMSVHSLADHVSAQYSPFGKVPDPDVLFAYLYITAGLGVVVWMIALRGARRRKRWVPWLAGMTFVVGAALAVFNLVITEHGTQVFPVLWSVLGLLPSVAGLIAVSLLWTRTGSRARP